MWVTPPDTSCVVCTVRGRRVSTVGSRLKIMNANGSPMIVSAIR